MRAAVLAAAATLAGSSAQAEPAHPYRIGILNEAWAPNHPTVEGLKAGLRARGLAEGRDVTFEVHFTEGKADALPAEARALIKANVDLIFTNNEAAALAAKDASQQIPIVFTLVGNPVAAGIVTDLARPGGNLTGIAGGATQIAAKRLEILRTLDAEGAPRLVHLPRRRSHRCGGGRGRRSGGTLSQGRAAPAIGRECRSIAQHAPRAAAGRRHSCRRKWATWTSRRRYWTSR